MRRRAVSVAIGTDHRPSPIRKHEHRTEPGEVATGSEVPAAGYYYDLHLQFLDLGSNQTAHQDDSFHNTLDRFDHSTTMPGYTN
ncbi:hypothetical protein DPV78_012249 [Talaromyces pinophilus]|nr:hypothetical protein DPV78_012249 [Talaromyces pinophilus]